MEGKQRETDKENKCIKINDFAKMEKSQYKNSILLLKFY